MFGCVDIKAQGHPDQHAQKARYEKKTKMYHRILLSFSDSYFNKLMQL